MTTGRWLIATLVAGCVIAGLVWSWIPMVVLVALSALLVVGNGGLSSGPSPGGSGYTVPPDRVREDDLAP